MCCAWSPAGDLVAGVFQDGLAALWDFRSGEVGVTPVTKPCFKFMGSRLAPLTLAGHVLHASASPCLHLRRVAACRLAPCTAGAPL